MNPTITRTALGQEWVTYVEAITAQEKAQRKVDDLFRQIEEARNTEMAATSRVHEAMDALRQRAFTDAGLSADSHSDALQDGREKSE